MPVSHSTPKWKEPINVISYTGVFPSRQNVCCERQYGLFLAKLHLISLLDGIIEITCVIVHSF